MSAFDFLDKGFDFIESLLKRIDGFSICCLHLMMRTDLGKLERIILKKEITEKDKKKAKWLISEMRKNIKHAYSAGQKMEKRLRLYRKSIENLGFTRNDRNYKRKNYKR